MSQPEDIRRPPAAPPRRRRNSGSLQGANGQKSGNATPGWGESIRQLYDGVVQEPLPPDFLKLLDELKNKNPKK